MKKAFSKIYLGLVYLFLYAPIIVLIVFSLTNQRANLTLRDFLSNGMRNFLKTSLL